LQLGIEEASKSDLSDAASRLVIFDMNTERI
jgi:hypothetical protein